MLGPKNDLNDAILHNLSQKFDTPVTVLNENEASARQNSRRTHLIYGGSWAPHSQQDVIRLKKDIRDQYGFVDVLLVSESSQDIREGSCDFISQLNKHLLAQFWIAMAFLPGMLERNKGAILSIAMGRTSTLANAGVMRTLYEDILEKDTKVTLTLVESNSFLSRFLPSLPNDFLSNLIVEGLGRHTILILPSFHHYLFHWPRVIARKYWDPILDYLIQIHSAVTPIVVSKRKIQNS